MTLPLVLSLVLAALAAAHAWWATGRIWPAASEPDLARAVIGDGRSRMPPPWQCAAVAMALLAVAIWPWVVVTWPDESLVLIGSIVIGAVFSHRHFTVRASRTTRRPSWTRHGVSARIGLRNRSFGLSSR